jgi:hypothetical protein
MANRNAQNVTTTVALSPDDSITQPDTNEEWQDGQETSGSSPFSLPDATNIFSSLPIIRPEDLGQHGSYSQLDQFYLQTTLSVPERVMAQLYLISDSAGAPKYLVDKLMSCLRTGIHNGFDIHDPLLPSTRETFMARLQASSSLPPPEAVRVQLESGSYCTVWRNCFPKLLQDHLLSECFSQISFLDLPNSSSPFRSEPSSPVNHSSFARSDWFYHTYSHYRTQLDTGKYMLHPLILYIDKTGVDGIMKNTVEPLVCTSALLNQEQRQDTKNWIVLGYLPNQDSVQSPDDLDEQHFPKRSSSLRNYHRCLASLLAPLRLMQREMPPMLFRRGDSVEPLRIICPVVSVLGDNLSQNALCARLDNKTASSVRMSRRCLTSNLMSDAIPHVCIKFPDRVQHKLTLAALGVFYCRSQKDSYRSHNLQEWVAASSTPPHPFSSHDMGVFRQLREKLADDILRKCLGSHCVLNAFNGIDLGFGGCVHSATVGDVMHSFESGIVKLVVEILLDPLPPTSVRRIDNMVENVFGSHGPN